MSKTDEKIPQNVSELSGFIYHDEYLKYQFGKSHPFKPIREKYTLDVLRELEVIDGKAQVFVDDAATELQPRIGKFDGGLRQYRGPILSSFSRSE